MRNSIQAKPEETICEDQEVISSIPDRVREATGKEQRNKIVTPVCSCLTVPYFLLM